MRKLPSDTETFCYYNANPIQKFTGDCVVRALATLPGYTWMEVFDDLCTIARKKCCMPSNDEAWDTWLKDHGYVRYPMPKKANGKLYKLGEFVKSDFVKDTEGVIVSVASHLTCVLNRKVHDTWNCTGYTVRRYYKKV